MQRVYNACRLFEAEPAQLDVLSVCQAGGKDPSKLPQAIDKANEHIQQALEG